MSTVKVSTLETKYEAHIKDKGLTANKRNADRHNINDKEVVVCFDLENVITCPRSNVSNFFYKRKLSVYNMTGHCSKDKFAYNVIWNEQTGGRGSNELASAIMVIIEHVVEKHPDIDTLTLWSDSCVAQNRNKVLCYAL